MCAEMSGLSWTGYTTEESGPKSWGEMKPSGVAPFGQMPLLKTPSGQNLGQSRAIANYIARKAGPVLEGKTHQDFAMSQMCLEEGEDIISAVGGCQLGAFATVEARNSKLEEAKALLDPNNMEDGLAKHFKNLDLLCRSDVNDDGKHSDCRFTSVSGWLCSSAAHASLLALTTSRIPLATERPRATCYRPAPPPVRFTSSA
jgi:hypothetical protein